MSDLDLFFKVTEVIKDVYVSGQNRMKDLVHVHQIWHTASPKGELDKFDNE